MLETSSYTEALPAPLPQKYKFLETRNASIIMKATNPREFSDLCQVLENFSLSAQLLMTPGGNRGLIPITLDNAFHERGWQEARIDVESITYLVTGSHVQVSGESKRAHIAPFETDRTYQTGYKVDNVKGRIALDVEWNAKDGNLDRDLSAYRSWFEHGIIDAAVLITKVHSDCRQLCTDLWERCLKVKPEYANRKQPVNLNTTTTTSFEKARPRVLRGDAGACPLLVVGICMNTWDGSEYDEMPVETSNTLTI